MSGAKRILQSDNDSPSLGALWFCADRWPQGSVPSGLSRYYHGQWSSYREKEELPNDYAANYFRDSLGWQFVMTLSGLAFRQPQKWTYPLGRQQKTEINWTSASIVETAETGVVISNGKEVLLLKKDTSHKTRCCLEPFLRIAATHNEPLVIRASIGDGKHN